MIRAALLFIAMLAPLSIAAQPASGPQYPDLSAYLEKADAVVRVRVTRTELLDAAVGPRRIECGQRIEGTVLDDFRDTVPGRSVSIVVPRMDTQVVLGQQYLAFLQRVAAPSAEAATLDRDAPIRSSARSQSACAPLAVGLRAGYQRLWPILERWSDEEGETEYWVVPPAEVDIPRVTPLQVYRIKVHTLEINGRIVERDGWKNPDVYDGLPPMPASFVDYTSAIRWMTFERLLRRVALPPERAVR